MHHALLPGACASGAACARPQFHAHQATAAGAAASCARRAVSPALLLAALCQATEATCPDGRAFAALGASQWAWGLDDVQRVVSALIPDVAVLQACLAPAVAGESAA